jgi:hypothetical protein
MHNCDGAVEVVRLPPPWFELRIFRLPGKCGYSTRPPGTTHSLIWVEVYVASVTLFEKNLYSKYRTGTVPDLLIFLTDPDPRILNPEICFQFRPSVGSHCRKPLKFSKYKIFKKIL